MKKFYFTYSNTKMHIQPYSSGYTLVNANDLSEAGYLFQMVHPDTRTGKLNCKCVLTEQEVVDKNLGHCHEIIGVELRRFPLTIGSVDKAYARSSV